ncbi:MAG: recombination regulator RecX [Zoogloeaceae bacterium]|jgi:regulatory protein|nr:recombination regulator RecX [Zoogloeaceae bacterium]
MAEPHATLRAQALRLLARRDLSRRELEQRLAPSVDAASAEALRTLLDDLAARQLLSDARVAENRARVRGTRYGNQRLARELRQAGLEEEQIAAALAQSGDEIRRCREVWQKKYGGTLATLPEAATPQAQARQRRFLLARGFSPATIRAALDDRDEWREQDEWDDAE